MFYKFLLVLSFSVSTVHAQEIDWFPGSPHVRDTLSNDSLTLLLGKLMAYHEKVVPGIRYNAKPPRFSYDDNMTDPNMPAHYDFETRMLRFMPTFKYFKAPQLFENVEATWMSLPVPIAEMRDLLSHELGHYLTAIMLDRVQYSWLDHVFFMENALDRHPDSMGTRIIVEGIAEYFGTLFGIRDWVSRFDTSTWTHVPLGVTREHFASYYTDVMIDYVYGGGYKLVKPIIDSAGVQGIEWLLNHPLRVSPPDFSAIPPYQRRALQELEQTAAKNITKKKKRP